jgi:hypothetical protein
MTGAAPMNAETERARLKDKFPAEFRDGARTAFLGKGDGTREKGSYPLGFHSWPIDRRNAWFAGFNHGMLERVAREKALAHSE